MPDWWTTPEGVHVLPDGAWRVGGFAILHAPSLRYLKARLVFEEGGAFLVEGGQRVPVEVKGPAFEVTGLRLSLSDQTGRFECLVREGQARAVLSRGAHQALLEHVEETDGGFALRVGTRRIPVRT
jgi:hypothetical protein